MNQYAFFNLDNTIYKGYSTSEFYLFLVDKGIIDNRFKQCDRELGQLYHSGKMTYSTITKLVIQLQAQALKGLTIKQVSDLGNQFMNAKQRLFPFTKPLLSYLDSAGFKSIIISAATAPTLDFVTKHLKVHDYFASDLEVKNNQYTGKVIRLLNNGAKKQITQKFIGPKTKSGLTLSFGDSTGDIAMLSAVDHAFVINPHQDKIKLVARQKGWPIVTSHNIIAKVSQVLSE